MNSSKGSPRHSDRAESKQSTARSGSSALPARSPRQRAGSGAVEWATATEPPRATRSKRGLIPVVAATIVAVALAWTGYRHFHVPPAPRLTDKDTIVLAGLHQYDRRSGVRRNTPAGARDPARTVSVLEPSRTNGSSRLRLLMGLTADAAMMPQVARAACERTGSAAVLEGLISSLGTSYVVGLRAQNCSDGSVLDEEQVQAARKEDVLAALSGVAVTFRTRVGESLATVEKHSTPLAEATTIAGGAQSLQPGAEGARVRR